MRTEYTNDKMQESHDLLENTLQYLVEAKGRITPEYAQHIAKVALYQSKRILQNDTIKSNI